MVRVITNDDLCCEITLNPASYNLIKLSCENINTNLTPSITAIDMSSRVENGDLLHSVIGLHDSNENAHKTLFNKKANVSDLSNVATSGDYNDLSNKPVIPTIPEVNNATLTITQGGTTKGTFTANAGSDVTIDIDSVTGKADTDLSNVPSSKGILEESYVNGASWYRVYSDGFCKQGGLAQATASASAQQINLLKNYANTNYSIFITRYNTNADSYWQVTVTNHTTSYFETGYSCTKLWFACGYIR